MSEFRWKRMFVNGGNKDAFLTSFEHVAQYHLNIAPTEK